MSNRRRNACQQRSTSASEASVRDHRSQTGFGSPPLGRWSTWSRITGGDAKSGRVLLRFPHGEYVPVSGNGGRLLLHGYSRLYAVQPRARG